MGFFNSTDPFDDNVKDADETPCTEKELVKISLQVSSFTIYIVMLEPKGRKYPLARGRR